MSLMKGMDTHPVCPREGHGPPHWLNWVYPGQRDAGLSVANEGNDRPPNTVLNALSDKGVSIPFINDTHPCSRGVRCPFPLLTTLNPAPGGWGFTEGIIPLGLPKYAF